MNIIKKQFILGLFLISVVACQTNVVAPQMEPQQTSVPPSNQSTATTVKAPVVVATIAPTLPPTQPIPTEVIEKQLEVQNVTRKGNIHGAWWSSENNTLDFSFHNAEGNFAYDPVSEKITRLEFAEILAQTPVPEIFSPLYRPPYVAPSSPSNIY